MRKPQKQEILEMIQTLHQAHDEIKNNIDKKNYVLVQDMLSQCQECAISIGTAIEKFEGEGFATVSFVEAYCDVLFSAYEELNGSDVNANKIYKNLKKQLLRIENSIKNDVPIRKEVAFFPYKASMWDALESVYLAAKEDPNCDAYCVPIPYYDRNPDKSLGQMHYEGNEYPKNIEIVDWQTYNFEERKPDAIYIHNPYDDWNLVTCVHPRYFSANLKKYTETLVYIPYFVLDEIEPDDQAKIDTMKHFVWTPGVINADKVVVQSENMRQIYINEYQKAAQANGLREKHVDRKQLEEKFLGTGSPKFDKVLNTKKEDLDIPEEWLKIIQKPDGSWKKIIFYNTSIAALLENNEKMLEKMKDVFRIFKENKDEVALLWRPHPLIKSTVSAMRPQLWMEYEKIVEQYKKEGWGIYDDSSDMDRAVVLSDAYYGDMSSVVPVYQKTKKNILIQNVRDTRNCTCMDFDIHDSKCIFVPRAFPMVIFEDLENGKVSNISITCSSPKNNLGDEEYGTVVKIDDDIIIAPFHGDKFVVMTEKGERKIGLKTICNSDILPFKLKFNQMIHYNQKIYFIGFQIPVIICYDIENKIFYEVSSYRNATVEILKDNLIMRVTNNGIHAYMIVWKTKYIIDFNMETEETLIISLEEGECPISICSEKTRIWYGFVDKPYIICNDMLLNKKEYVETNLLNDRVFFSIAFETLNRIYFIGNEKDDTERSFALYYDYSEKRFVKCDEVQNIGYIQAVKKISEQIIIIMAVNRGKGKICIWNVKEEYIKNQLIEISIKEQYKIFEQFGNSTNDNANTILIEADGIIGLSAYVNYINHIDNVYINNRESEFRGKIIFNATKTRE